MENWGVKIILYSVKKSNKGKRASAEQTKGLSLFVSKVPHSILVGH